MPSYFCSFLNGLDIGRHQSFTGTKVQNLHYPFIQRGTDLHELIFTRIFVILRHTQKTTSQAVLVVEDEPLVRLMALDMVEEAGFEALGAANASGALAMIEKRPDISLVFTDVDLSAGMNGVGLAFEIRERWPPIEIIVTSGRNEPNDLALPERGRFLPKPYLCADLMKIMHSLLD